MRAFYYNNVKTNITGAFHGQSDKNKLHTICKPYRLVRGERRTKRGRHLIKRKSLYEREMD